MIEIKSSAETLFTEIKSIFLNPYHYTYVIQKEDNYIYLYDEMTMEIIGKSKFPFADTLKVFTFMDNFNTFCAFVEGKAFVFFNLELDGVINHRRIPLMKGNQPQNLNIYSISYFEKIKQLVCLSKHTIYYVNLNGQITREIAIVVNSSKIFESTNKSRQLNLINGFSIKNNRWILIEQNWLHFAKIGEEYQINDSLAINSKITSIFLDASVRGQFIAFITQHHNVIILKKNSDNWIVCHKFRIPNLNIKKLCFFYPGVNTSTTNKYKDRMYILIHGDVNAYEQKSKYDQSEDFERFVIPKEHLQEKALYILEFSISELLNESNLKIKKRSKRSFVIKNIGFIKYTIWANQHSENNVRILNDKKMIQSINLISLLDGLNIAQEWVCLGYKFESRSSNVLYEQKEDQFQQIQKQNAKIKFEELNDWSYSLFSREALIRKSIKRLNCLKFDP